MDDRQEHKQVERQADNKDYRKKIRRKVGRKIGRKVNTKDQRKSERKEYMNITRCPMSHISHLKTNTRCRVSSSTPRGVPAPPCSSFRHHPGIENGKAPPVWQPRAEAAASRA